MLRYPEYQRSLNDFSFSLSKVSLFVLLLISICTSSCPAPVGESVCRRAYLADCKLDKWDKNSFKRLVVKAL